MASSIGGIAFLRFDRRPPTAGEQVTLEAQAGKDGHAAWQTGSRGRTFSLATMRDVDTFANAQTLCATLEALRGTVVAIVFADTALGNYLVNNVEATPEKILHGQGGVVGGASAAIVSANWTLTPWS